MMLHLHPDLVRMEKAEPGFVGDLEPERLFKEGMRGISPNGVLGNPVGATAEMGSQMLDALSGWLAEQLQRERICRFPGNPLVGAAQG